ncbi:peptidase dimerization domain-containing protein [Streptomyces mauvecolor]
MDADQDLRSTVDALMDGLRSDLERLARIPSIAFPGFPPEPVRRAHDLARDAVIIADLGNIRPGSPTLTPGLRGASEVVVEVRTPAEARHSGECGGAAPDALPVLLHALATLRDADGDVAVAGLRREAWSGTSCTDEEYRDLAAVRDGVPLIGTVSLGERLWGGPAVTGIGVDAPSVDHATPALVPYARHEPNLRFPSQQDPREAQGALVAHVEALRPFGIPLTVTPGDAGPGFEPATGGPASRAALSALREGWGTEPDFAAGGGSIPLVDGLAKAAPGAEVLLFGVQEGMCALHAPNEHVLSPELRGGGLAEAAFLRGSAAAFGGRS